MLSEPTLRAKAETVPETAPQPPESVSAKAAEKGATEDVLVMDSCTAYEDGELYVMATAPLPTPERLAEPASDTAQAPAADFVGVKTRPVMGTPAIETEGMGTDSDHVEPTKEMVGGEAAAAAEVRADRERLRPPSTNEAAEMVPEPVATPVEFAYDMVPEKATPVVVSA